MRVTQDDPESAMQLGLALNLTTPSNLEIKKKKKDFYVFVSGEVHLSVGTPRSQKMVLDPVQLELQAVVSLLMWVLGIQLRSSERAMQSLNC